MQAIIMAVRDADNMTNNARPIHTTPRFGGPTLKQLTFDWKVIYESHELCNFEIEVNIFMSNNYNVQKSKTVPVILN